jgi:hypothetical protein
MPIEIANADLTEAHVPPPDAQWRPIGRFALTFNGYEAWGSFANCAQIANHWAHVYAERQELPQSLTELRTCLFFEQRRWRHFGYDPDDEAMAYIRALLEEIRRTVGSGDPG